MRVLAGLVLFLGLCMPATAGQFSPIEYQYWTDTYEGDTWNVDIDCNGDLFDQVLCISRDIEYSRDDFQRLFTNVCYNRDRSNFFGEAEVTVVREHIEDDYLKKTFDIECEDGWSFSADWHKYKFGETWGEGYLVIRIKPSPPRLTVEEQIEQLLDEIYGGVGVEPTPTPTPTPTDDSSKRRSH